MLIIAGLVVVVFAMLCIMSYLIQEGGASDRDWDVYDCNYDDDDDEDGDNKE